MTTTAGPNLARKKTVLLVDDESAIVLLFEMELARMGYHVLTAHSGTEAILISAETPIPIDILVTDWKMPDMNGHELARKLLPKRPGMKVILMSGYPEVASSSDIFVKNKAVFLCKPFSSNELAQNIRKLLELQTNPGEQAA